ncbi:hypothetical protein DFH08DRAFT_986436 [Mycena albidolilacea]|uniref:Uncharacterized protein n=1 Tax=Mycena albidolilacea TaxID=1033008 RepID=A0AAD7E9U1_9AGAR|nr:hypothetical protein DFH08DRAFT_986436 [Mycena albidolilacea]
MDHVKQHWNRTQEQSHCVAHDAVDKPDREASGTASSGIGAVDCVRHNMKQPLAVGDLQLRERYINMDYMFFRSISHLPLLRFFVSYNIVCQWQINLWNRLSAYQDPALAIDTAKEFTFLVPKFHLPIEACNLKFSFNLTPDIRQTDSEPPERGWANTNPLARSTKEMGPGSRCDTLDDHFNGWNHKKIIALGATLCRKVEAAVPEMVTSWEVLQDKEEFLGADAVEQWTRMAILWEADESAPNPFETQRKDEHVAQVRWELAEEAAAIEAAGVEEVGAVRGDMHITELLGMSLQLEDQQRILAFDVASTGLHPTDCQCRTMVERSSKLRRKIFAWIDVQAKFFPAAATLASTAEAIPGIPVSEIRLWLPSSVAGKAGEVRREVLIDATTYHHEYRLRVGQAKETLHEVRRLLLVRTHVYKLKDTHARGVRANGRSQDKIAVLTGQVRRAANQYYAARTALMALGGVLKRSEWERSLKVLAVDNVRGLLAAKFHDPERKSKKQRRTKKLRRGEWGGCGPCRGLSGGRW